MAEEFQASKDDLKFLLNCYNKLINSQSSANLQWRAAGCISDHRQGMSCLLNLLSVIAGNLFENFPIFQIPTHSQVLVLFFSFIQEVGKSRDVPLQRIHRCDARGPQTCNSRLPKIDWQDERTSQSRSPAFDYQSAGLNKQKNPRR